MAKKRSPRRRIGDVSVTPDRFQRLYRFVGLLAEGRHSRAVLLRRLHQDVRGFYRDLEALRKAGVPVIVSEGRYAMTEPPAAARTRLPIPDPHLTLEEALQLAKGRTAVHRKLKGVLNELTEPEG
jgi:predicted DNA-binding transcriptional regulator YafY